MTAQPCAPPSDSKHEARALMRRLALGAQPGYLSVLVNEHLSTRGKEVRLNLALDTCEALDVPAEAAIVWAAACELLHNATLVHDDIQDEETERRGQETVWARHGVAQAINIGDLLLMLPFRAIDQMPAEPAVCWNLTRAISFRAEQAARGQSEELQLLLRRAFTWPDYLGAAAGKTGALLALPVEGALLLRGTAPELARSLADTLVQAGTLFQFQDDLRDLYSPKLGREPGSDVKKGRVSALMVAYWELAPDDREWLLGLLDAPQEDVTDSDIQTVAHRFRERGALLEVHRRMEALSKELLAPGRLIGNARVNSVVIRFVEQVFELLQSTSASTVRPDRQVQT